MSLINMDQRAWCGLLPDMGELVDEAIAFGTMPPNRALCSIVCAKQVHSCMGEESVARGDPRHPPPHRRARRRPSTAPTEIPARVAAMSETMSQTGLPAESDADGAASAGDRVAETPRTPYPR